MESASPSPHAPALAQAAVACGASLCQLYNDVMDAGGLEHGGLRSVDGLAALGAVGATATGRVVESQPIDALARVVAGALLLSRRRP